MMSSMKSEAIPGTASEIELRDMVKQRRQAEKKWSLSPEKQIMEAAQQVCSSETEEQPTPEVFVNMFIRKARIPVDDPLAKVHERPKLPGDVEPGETPVSSSVRIADIIEKSTAQLQTDLDAISARHEYERTTGAQLSDVNAMEGIVEGIRQRSAVSFMDKAPGESPAPSPAPHDAAPEVVLEADEMTSAAEQLELRKKEWEREEAKRKALEVDKAAANSESVAIKIAKKLFMLKQTTPPAPLPPGETPPEGYISRPMQEAELAASLHAAYAAFLSGTHSRAIEFYNAGTAAGRVIVRAEKALKTLEEKKIKNAEYVEGLRVPKVVKEKAVVLAASITAMIHEVNGKLETALSAQAQAKKDNFIMEERVKHVKQLVDLATKPAPVFDPEVQAKAERDRKLNKAIAAMNEASTGAISADAIAKFDREVERLTKIDDEEKEARRKEEMEQAAAATPSRQ